MHGALYNAMEYNTWRHQTYLQALHYS